MFRWKIVSYIDEFPVIDARLMIRVHRLRPFGIDIAGLFSHDIPFALGSLGVLSWCTSPLRKLCEVFFHHVLHDWREEISLDGRDAPGRLCWDEIDSNDAPIRFRPFHGDLGMININDARGIGRDGALLPETSFQVHSPLMLQHWIVIEDS